jgi:outer membrane protein assembly factor BamB
VLPRRRTIRCDACAAVWSAARVRFCGRCGGALDGRGPTAGRHPRRDRARRSRPDATATGPTRWRSTGTTVVVAVVAVGVAAAGLSLSADPTTRGSAMMGDPDVILPPAREITTPVLPDAAAEPVAGPRLTCRPAGCEAWRRPFEWGPAWAVGHGLLVSVGADQASAVDLRTGRERWVSSLGSLLPRTSDGTPIRRLDGGAPLGIAIDAHDVAVGTGDRLALLDAAKGATRWVARSTGWGLAEVALLPELVLVTSTATPPRGGDHTAPWEVRLVAIDRADGTTRWQRAVQSPLELPVDRSDATGAIGVIDLDGGLLGLDPADGSVRWRRDLPANTWATRAGPWVLVDGPDGHELIDPTDGSSLGALDGWLGHEVRAAGDGYVSVRYPLDRRSATAGRGDRGASTPEVVGLTADGSIRWQHPLEAGAAWGCCAVIVPWQDGVLVAGNGHAGWVLDATDGTLLADGVHLPVRDGMWSTPAGQLVGWRSDGLVVAHDHDGVIEVTGPNAELVSFEPAVVFADGELLGLRVAAAGDRPVGAVAGRVVQ